MRRLLQEVDLHAAAMIALLAPGCVLASTRWWWLGLVFLVAPAWYVVYSAFLSNPAVGRSVGYYFLANLLLLLAATALFVGTALLIRVFTS